jgi:tetratricopeptide (TPR) repeat protein
MNEIVQRLIKEAEEAYQNKQYFEAGRCYEEAAETTLHKSQAGKLFRSASDVYRNAGKPANADECYQKAIHLLEGQQKAECILDGWKDLIDTIVHFEYDCSFEWRGETDGSHDSYEEDLKQLQIKAEVVLKQALSVKGVDKDRIIEKARDECRTREKEDGWGASRCWSIISNAT